MRLKFNLGVLRLVLAGIIFLLGLYFLFLIRGILFPFILAIVLAYILNPIVTSLEQLGIPRVLAILIVYLAGIFVVFLIIVYGIPVVTRELNDLAEAIPELTVEARLYISYLYREFRSITIPESVSQVIDESIRNVEALVIREIRQMANTLLGLFSRLISILLAPVLAFYLLKDWSNFSRRLMFIFPVSVREEIISLWGEIDKVLISFIRGHLIVATFVGLLTALGLTIIGMDYVLLLSIIAGVTDLIPYFGPLIGSFPALILALLKSKTMALYVLIVVVIVQQLESNIISPTVLGESLGLHPVTVIFALLAGGKLLGLIGLLLAVPSAAVLRIVFAYMLSKLTA